MPQLGRGGSGGLRGSCSPREGPQDVEVVRPHVRSHRTSPHWTLETGRAGREAKAGAPPGLPGAPRLLWDAPQACASLLSGGEWVGD